MRRAWLLLFFLVGPTAAQDLPPSVVLPSAPGALFGAVVHGLDVASGTLAVARSYDLYGTGGYEAEPPALVVLEIGRVAEEPLLRVRLTEAPTVVALDRTASRVVCAHRDGFEVRSTSDGSVIFAEPLVGVRGVAVAVDGSIAVSVDAGVVLYGADGTLRSRHTLTGTATDEMRVYTGEYGPTYHDTYVVDVAAQPVAMAWDDAGRLAVSMTDGSVHLVEGGAERTLGSAGTATDGNPHAVTSLGLRWSGDHLLGLTGAGALVRFDRSGGVRVVHDGRCSAREIDAVIEDFPDDRDAWTIDAYCESAGAAIFSGSRLLHFTSMGVRVRSARTGVGIAAFETLDSGPMALDGDASLVTTNAEGLVRVHALPSGRVSATEPRVGTAGTIAVHPERDLVLVSVNPSLPSDSEDEQPWTTRGFHLDGSPRPLDLSGVTIAVARDADRMVVARYEPVRLALTDLDGTEIRALVDPVPAAEYVQLAVAPDGHGVAVDRDGALHWLGDDGASRLVGTGNVITAMELDADASHLACVRFDAASFTYAAEVIELATGRVLYAAPSGQEVAVSPDGRLVAHHEPGTGDVVVRRVADGGEVARLPHGDFGANGLALGPDGALWYAQTITGVVRWAYPAAPAPIGLGALRPEVIRFSGPIVVIDDQHFGTHVVRASDGVVLASVHGLVTGGFAAVAPSGAFDGSSEAAGAFFTIRGTNVERGLDPATDAAFRAPGLLARALGGAVVPLP